MADHSPADIIMDMRDGTVKAGTLPALVERLTSHENPGEWLGETSLIVNIESFLKIRSSSNPS